MKKILFSRGSECLQPLRELVEQQTHRALVLWALDCAKRFLDIFEELYPDEKRPHEALVAADKWARGEIKMPIAKKAIHACHDAATSSQAIPHAQAAARAIGHAAGTVHVETHALGVVFYGLTALLFMHGINSTDSNEANLVVEPELKWFCERLLFWQDNAENQERTWAAFLLKDTPNKELILRQRLQDKSNLSKA